VCLLIAKKIAVQLFRLWL